MTKDQILAALKILIDKLSANTITPEELELVDDLINWHRGHSFSEWEKFVKEIENLPTTWYPALILEMVKAAYGKNVFLPGGASRIVQQMEVELGKAK